MDTTSADSSPRIAVVTGAGTGIGRAVALGLLGAGWCVALLGRRLAPLQDTARRAPHADRTLCLPTDVSDADAVAHAFTAIVAQWGRVDLLFNNAGTFAGGGPLQDVTAQTWREVMAVNLDGAFFCAQAAYAQMLRQSPPGGRIINNGSVSAQVPRPHAVAYSTSKHAINGLSKSLALEGRAHGITCGQIDIGNALTELTADMPRGMLQPDGQRRPEATMGLQPVVDAVLYQAHLPPGVAVPFMTVMAAGMPLVGRG
ncbi:SDR family oxidoreductase [Amphibiibacter pelophylacis]|uniref:SDR family oxidoreductase n=1 Tax=Amphibiibacter pelophylacis TaxID=1799477 RepID=A0ACC6P560_9BURK